MRKWAIHNLAAILKQHKRKHPKTEVDLKEQAVTVSQEETHFCGPRPDNHWICYDSDQRPGNVTFLIKDCHVTRPSMQCNAWFFRHWGFLEQSTLFPQASPWLLRVASWRENSSLRQVKIAQIGPRSRFWDDWRREGYPPGLVNKAFWCLIFLSKKNLDLSGW